MVKVRNIHTDQVNEVSEAVAAGLSKDSYEVMGADAGTKASAPKAPAKDADPAK